MPGLGISVPTKDLTSGGLSAAVKQEVREKHGAVALDTIVGLAVFPDADGYFEFVVAGQAQVYPGDPTYFYPGDRPFLYPAPRLEGA